MNKRYEYIFPRKDRYSRGHQPDGLAVSSLFDGKMYK